MKPTDDEWLGNGNRLASFYVGLGCGDECVCVYVWRGANEHVGEERVSGIYPRRRAAECQQIFGILSGRVSSRGFWGAGTIPGITSGQACDRRDSN
jgi:hypothetical protein